MSHEGRMHNRALLERLQRLNDSNKFRVAELYLENDGMAIYGAGTLSRIASPLSLLILDTRSRILSERFPES